MNLVIVKGNLGMDPEIKMTKSGRAMARFTVASNEVYTTAYGEQKELTDWIPVVVWGDLATVVGNYLTKGRHVLVTGKYKTRSYEGPNREKRYITELRADTVAIPLNPREAGAGEDGSMQ